MARHLLIGVMLALMIATAGADETEGKAVFQRWCVHCHGDQPSALRGAQGTTSAASLSHRALAATMLESSVTITTPP